MINKNDILNFVKHVHRKGQGIPDRNPMHPHREWFIGLLVFVLITLVGMVMSVRSFEIYKNVDTQTYEVDVTVPSYNQTLARTVLQLYADREEAYAQLINQALTSTESQLPAVVEVASSTASSTGTGIDEEVASSTIDETTTAQETDTTEEDVPVMTFE